MRTFFLVAGSTLIVLAAILHIYFFTLESLTWQSPKTWRTFGLPSQEHAEIIRPMAFNQGFYNLFLALGSLIGLAILGICSTVGYTLMIFASTCMIGAGAVLFFSVKKSRKAAIIQAVPPLIGVLLVLIGLSL